MKCSELKTLLERAALFQAAHASEHENRSREEMFSMLDRFANQTVAQFSKVVAAAVSPASTDKHDVAHFGSFLRALIILLGNDGKPAVVKDLETIARALDSHSKSDFATLLESVSKPAIRKGKAAAPLPIRQDIVLRYVRRLEEALGDDSGFQSIFAALETDKDVSAAEIVAIAKAFANSRAKGRNPALKNIFSRHQAIMISRAKSAATAGRIAG